MCRDCLGPLTTCSRLRKFWTDLPSTGPYAQDPPPALKPYTLSHTDLTVVLRDGSQVKAHAAVLASASKAIKRMLKDQSIHHISVEAGASEFSAVVNFLYRAELPSKGEVVH